MLANAFPGAAPAGASALARLDPRAKLVLGALWLAAILALGSPAGLALMAACLLALWSWGQVGWAALVQTARGVIPFCLAVGALHLTTDPGRALARLGPVVLTRPGLTLGLLAAARLLLLAWAASLLTLTTSAQDLTDALGFLLRPLGRVGVPVDELALMMTIALRFLPTVLEQAEKIHRAQVARGLDLGRRGLGGRLAGAFALLVPLLMLSFVRAEETALAMEARGYYPGVRRSRMREMRLGRQDAAAAAVTVVVLAAAALAGRWV